jgi:cytochrome c6
MAGDIGAGKLIFEGNCAACHAGGQNVIQNEKTL